jgi:hypothetical protein
VKGRRRWWLLGSIVAVGVILAVIILTWRDETAAFGKIYVDFGVAREATTSTVVMNLCASVDSPQPECKDSSPSRPEVAAAFVDGDLRAVDGSGKRFPVDQLTVNALNIGVDGLQIKLAADSLQPREVQEGRYEGAVIVERGEIDTATGAITPQTKYRVVRDLVVNLTRRTPARALLAFLVLALGAFLGAGTKWVNETLAPFAVLRRRWMRVHRRLRRWWPDLPEDVREAIRESRFNIRDDDATDVGATLDALGQQQGTLVSFARTTRDIKGEIEKQESALSRWGGSSLAYADSAMDAQATVVRDLRETSWPWTNPSETQSKWEAAKRNARLVTREVREFVNAPSATRREHLEARFAQVAQAGSDGLTKDLDPEPTAFEAFEAIETKKGEASRVGAESSPPATRESAPTRKERLLDGLPLATTVITGASVVAVGMMTQFFRNPGFDGSLIDYLVLGGWAFAIEVAGITVLELGGQLKGAAPTAVQT